MGTNKKHIAPEHLTEWLASTGFLFPTDEKELERFEKLFGDPNLNSEGSINHERILKNVFDDEVIVKKLNPDASQDNRQLKMVARNGGDVPKHILDRIIKNQQKVRGDDNGAEKKEN